MNEYGSPLNNNDDENEARKINANTDKNKYDLMNMVETVQECIR